MDKAEKNFNTSLDNWRMVTGEQGTMIYDDIWDENLLSQVEEAGCFYIDDINHKVPPEDIPGSLGSFGVRAVLEGIDPGEYQFKVIFFMPPNFYNPQKLDLELIDKFFNNVNKPLIISVDGEEPFSSKGGANFSLH